MTTGVWPDSMVAGVGSTGRKLPASLSLSEEVDARSDVVGRPAVGDRGHQHPVSRGAGGRGVTVEGDLALELGAQQVVDPGDLRDLGRVVADGHVAPVVVDPGAVRILELRRDVIECRHLVRREQVGVRQRNGLSQVEHVGCAVGAGQLFGRVDLVLAGGVGLGGVDLDVVLLGEGVDDLLVVGPVGRQRDDVELPLLLCRRRPGRPSRRSRPPRWPRRPSHRTRSDYRCCPSRGVRTPRAPGGPTQPQGSGSSWVGATSLDLLSGDAGGVRRGQSQLDPFGQPSRNPVGWG